MNLADAMAEDVREAEQDRQLDAACLELVDEFLEVDRLVGPLVRVDGDVPRVVDAEIVLAPVADTISLDRIINFPGISDFLLDNFRHSRHLPR